jgi:hypothetical protein
MQYFIILLTIIPNFLFAQTISGKIEDENGVKVIFANITTKDSINAVDIKEFVVARNGYYSITPIKTYKQLVLEISTNNYQKEIFIIDSFVATKNYIHNFHLVKDTVIRLQDVVIKAKMLPFQIKGDTVNYNVSVYRDGSERKIQDVIKKLPGIEVNEKTGEIKYKGKSVETVKIDGEDLFASNYSIGTKNINVDMVEQVQAIENYSDNPLLKGIESGGKVALNLTLKNKKTDYSGSIDLALGIIGSKTAIDASTNILGVSKKYKSFATGSYNNVGLNNTPFDHFSYNPNIERLKESDFLAKKYIPETYFNTDIDAERSNINNSLFASYNAVFKIRKKLSLKNNFYCLDDRLTSQQLNIATNIIDDQEFATSDKYLIVKRPAQIRGDLQVKYNVTQKSLLEYSTQFEKENINTSNDITQNNNKIFNTLARTRDDYFKQIITYTAKLSEKKALQINAKYTNNSIPQEMAFAPSIIEPLLYRFNYQKSWFRKSNLMLQSTLLGSVSKGKYNLILGSFFKDIDINSDLIGTATNSNISINGFKNYSKYIQKNVFVSGNYKFHLKHFIFTPAITLSSMHQRFLDRVSDKTIDTTNFLLELALSSTYKINNFSAILVSTTFKQKPFSEDYFVENPVYISNRVVRENEVSLQVQHNKSVGLFYVVNNLYKQFQLNFGANYSENKGNYFSNLLIQQNGTRSVHFFLPDKNKLLSLSFMIEKYMPFLQGTVRLKKSYSNQLYKNIVNRSILRDNSMGSLNSSFFFKTAFDGKINFENTFEYRFLQSKTEGGLQFNNQSINNKFQIIIKPTKQFFLLLSTDYYLPTTQNNKHVYFFFDTDLAYQTKDKIYNFCLKARNVTNNKTLNQIDTNDYSTNNFQINLLPRHLMLSVSRNF